MTIRNAAFLLAMLLWTLAARAQPLLSAGSVAPDGPGARARSTHGWFVFSDRTPANGVVFHVPPRVDQPGGRPGTVRLAHETTTAPTFAAARDGRLYLVFESIAPNIEAFPSAKLPPRKVLSLEAVDSPEGLWATRPRGRLDAHASIGGEGKLLGFACSDADLFALRSDVPERPARLTLERLAGSGWAEVPLPAAMTGQYTPASRLRLFGVPGGVAILATSPGEPGPSTVLWIASLGGAAPSWEARPAPEAALASDACFSGGQIVIGRRADDGLLSLVAQPLAGGEWRPLATRADVGERFAMFPLDSDARVGVVWFPRASDAGDPRPLLWLAEFSAGTGRVLYDGPVGLASPISGADYILMGGMLVIVAGMVIAGLVRAPENPVIIPDGTSIAEPSRRLFAGLVDFSLAMLAVCTVARTPLSQLLTLEWWSGSAGQLTLLTTLAVLVVTSGILEALVGRTPGKLLTGCEVVSVRVRLGQRTDLFVRPTLTESLLRNALKWGVPPVGFLGLLDSSGRYRADQLARTAVIVRIPPDEPSDDADE